MTRYAGAGGLSRASLTGSRSSAPAAQPEEDRRTLSRAFCVFLLVVGLEGKLLQYVVLLTLVRLLHADAVLASTLGFTLSAPVNYYLNYRLAFRSSRPHGSALGALLGRGTGRAPAQRGYHAGRRSLAEPALPLLWSSPRSWCCSGASWWTRSGRSPHPHGRDRELPKGEASLWLI